MQKGSPFCVFLVTFVNISLFAGFRSNFFRSYLKGDFSQKNRKKGRKRLKIVNSCWLNQLMTFSNSNPKGIWKIMIFRDFVAKKRKHLEIMDMFKTRQPPDLPVF